MPSLNHHFVPQFYLRIFASDKRPVKRPKLINLYNLKKKLFVENASIRKQCYKRKFYGDTEEYEKLLAQVEQINSLLLSIIINLEQLPPKGSVAYNDLLFFTLLQQLRTKRQADIQNDIIDGVMKAAYEDDTRFKDVDFDGIRIGVKDPILVSMSALSPAAVSAIDDLEPCLVLLGGHKRFITSDNPVVVYNQYFEWVREMSNTGFLSKGLQLLYPLSPQCLLLLYDKSIYTVSHHQNVIRDVTDKDLRFINAMQFINSDENVYFDRMSYKTEIETIVGMFRDAKKYTKVRTLKFDKEQTPLSPEASTLIATFRETPNIRLNLSFMRIKRSAKKVSARKRLDDRYRKEFDFPEMEDHVHPRFAPVPSVPERYFRRQDKNK